MAPLTNAHMRSLPPRQSRIYGQRVLRVDYVVQLVLAGSYEVVREEGFAARGNIRHRCYGPMIARAAGEHGG